MKEYKEKDAATGKKTINEMSRNDFAGNKENVSNKVDDVIEVEDEDDIDDPVNTFLRNMRKGFKRANPTAPPEPKSQGQNTDKRQFLKM